MREFRDSGSNANTKICFEIRATALCPCLHTEGFPLYRPHKDFPQGTSTEDLGNTKRKFTTPLSNNTTSTQEVRHNTNHLYTQRDRHLAKQDQPLTREIRLKTKQQSPLHLEGFQLNFHNYLSLEGFQHKYKKVFTTLGDHKDHKPIFSLKQDPNRQDRQIVQV